MARDLMVQDPIAGEITVRGGKFNPILCIPGKSQNVPSKPTRLDSLDQARRNQPSARLSSLDSFDSRHASTLTKEKRAFYHTKGEMESYLEDAHNYRDFLVWQPSHARGATRGNNPSNFKPKNDFYDNGGGEATDTQRLSTSRLMVNRHLSSRNSVGSISRAGSRASVNEDVILTKPIATSTTKPGLSKEEKLRLAAIDTESSIKKFETNHHNLCSIENMTKVELIRLLESKGLDIPGEPEWDVKSNTYRKKRLKKAEYLVYARRELFKLETAPIVQRGQKIGKILAIVSIFKSLEGSVRVVAYDTDRSMSYNLFLGAAKLEDLDIPKVPVFPEIPDESLVFQDFSVTAEERQAEKQRDHLARVETDVDNWNQWASLLIERLQISPQGDLFVGSAVLLENGLSKGFCLTGRDVVSKEEAKEKDPSRVHVTAWFNM